LGNLLPNLANGIRTRQWFFAVMTAALINNVGNVLNSCAKPESPTAPYATAKWKVFRRAGRFRFWRGY